MVLVGHWDTEIALDRVDRLELGSEGGVACVSLFYVELVGLAEVVVLSVPV